MTEREQSAESQYPLRSETTQFTPSGLTYPVKALVRDDDAGLRALSVTRHFVELVSEFDDASYAAVNIRSGNELGRLAITLEIHGPASVEVTKADLISVLGNGVFLGEPTSSSSIALPHSATGYELVRMSVSSMLQAAASDSFDRPEWAPQANFSSGPGFAAPLPNERDSAEALLSAMARSSQQLWVRSVLGAADSLAAHMVIDELDSLMLPQAIVDYARVPVLARTVVISSTTVPVAVRVGLRQRGRGLQLTPIKPSEALSLWTHPLAALRSAAIGETHAVAITRLPAAGTMTSLGIATRSPSVPERPLDPVPATPVNPIRLGWATDAFGKPVDVELDASDLLRHIYVEGQSGSGKTTTIAQLFRSITRAGHQVIYLDPHGDGAARAAAYTSMLDESSTSYYIRHGDRAHPVRINPLAEPDADARERVMSELLELIQNMLDPQREGMVGERFKRTFTLVADAAFELFGSRTSITDVLALSLSKNSLRTLALAVRSQAPDAAARLEAELLSLGDKEFADLVSWFVSRLQPFLRTPALRNIIGTGEDSVNVLDLLESGKNLIVDLASLELGEDVSRVLGALWLLKIRNAIGHRTDRRRPIVLLIDEAHLYIFGALPGLIAEARKFGIGIVVATQAADSLPPRLARAIEANCGSAISLRTGINGANTASERLGGWPPRQLTRLADLTAAASLTRGGVPTPAFTLHVDHFDIVAAEGWDDHRIATVATEVAENSRALLWAPYADRKVLNDREVIDAVKATTPRRQPNPPATTDDLLIDATNTDGNTGQPRNREGLARSSQPAKLRTDTLLEQWEQNRSHGTPSQTTTETFDVVLDDRGANWIQVIAIIRGYTGMGLSDAKAASESVNSVLATGKTREDAGALVERLTAVHAKARIVPPAP